MMSPFTPLTSPLVPSLSRLCPKEMRVGAPTREKFRVSLSATMVLLNQVRFARLPGRAARTTAFVPPRLRVMVQEETERPDAPPGKVRCNNPLPAPFTAIWLPLMVLFLRLPMLPWKFTPPPCTAAMFSLIVQRSRMKPELKNVLMPPPAPVTLFRLMVESTMVSGPRLKMPPP